MTHTATNTFTRICIAALVSLIVGLTPLDCLTAGQGTKRVFVLNSFNRGYIWTDNMLRGIDDAFGRSGIKVETYVTFMDMKRIPSTPQYFSQLMKLIREGYKEVHFDAVLACDNDAFEFGMGRLIAGNPWGKFFHAYNLMDGQVWLFIPLWVFVGPFVFFRFVQAK